MSLIFAAAAGLGLVGGWVRSDVADFFAPVWDLT
jgi:hypothetical protein